MTLRAKHVRTPDQHARDEHDQELTVDQVIRYTSSQYGAYDHYWDGERVLTMTFPNMITASVWEREMHHKNRGVSLITTHPGFREPVKVEVSCRVKKWPLEENV